MDAKEKTKQHFDEIAHEYNNSDDLKFIKELLNNSERSNHV